jgi:hypothetical protein
VISDCLLWDSTAFGIGQGCLDNIGAPQLPAFMRPVNETTAPSERIAEIAEILGAGLQRALARKSSEVSADSGESSLHILPGQSGDPTPLDRRTPDA